MKLREKIFIWFIALVYLMGQMGCATSRYEYPPAEPLSEAYRAQLETIGVVSVPGVPDLHFDRPLHPSQAGVLTRTGRGAWEGVKKSTQWYSDVMDSTMNRDVVEGAVKLPVALVGPLGLVVGLALLAPFIPFAILGGLGGAIGGAFGVVEPPSYVEERRYIEGTEAHLQDTLAKYQIQEKLQSAFLKEARFRTSHTFVDIPEKEAQHTGERLPQGVDTVIELSVQRIGLKRVEDQEGVSNPSMVLALVVRARLVRGTEKTMWYDQTFVHETENHPYIYYRDNIFNPYYGVQADVQKAYQKLAEEMVEKLFIHNPSTSPATSATSAFSPWQPNESSFDCATVHRASC